MSNEYWLKPWHNRWEGLAVVTVTLSWALLVDTLCQNLLVWKFLGGICWLMNSGSISVCIEVRIFTGDWQCNLPLAPTTAMLLQFFWNNVRSQLNNLSTNVCSSFLNFAFNLFMKLFCSWRFSISIKNEKYGQWCKLKFHVQ